MEFLHLHINFLHEQKYGKSHLCMVLIIPAADHRISPVAHVLWIGKLQIYVDYVSD